MKKLVLVLTLAAFALAGAASAQDPNYFNNIGVYADEGATEFCANLGINTPLSLYVVLTKVTTPEVNGWEAKIEVENMLNLGVTPRYDNVDAATRPDEYIVGYGFPVPVSGGALVIADMQVLLQEFIHDPATPSYVTIDHVYFHVMPTAVPAYLDANLDGVELHPSTIDGHEGGAVFFLNNGCSPVAVEQDTWGGVKSLYR